MKNLPKHIARGRQRRRHILESSVEVARREGLDALTIGRVATQAGLSKPGLLNHFDSKQALQLATLQAGRAQFVEAVVGPASEEQEGLERIDGVLRRWVAHISMRPGGCFFTSVTSEFDARPGALRDRIAGMVREWLDALEGLLARAVQLGHLSDDTDVGDVAFRLHGYELSLNLRLQLFEEELACHTALRAMRGLLAHHATQLGQRVLDEAEDKP
ncbi:MAG: TetR/AcrR family transcriptional regulator [Myxococcales bacterium]|nr:TetR/AcrR family transcriptional regulator [Myxococcales bacterium]